MEVSLLLLLLQAKLLGGDLLLVTGGPAKTIKFYFGLALGTQPRLDRRRRSEAREASLRASAVHEQACSRSRRAGLAAASRRVATSARQPPTRRLLSRLAISARHLGSLG